MKRRSILTLTALLLLLLLLAGCGKAASMKNYRAYASSVVNAYVTDEEQRNAMLDTIKGWRKESDFDDFTALMSYYSNGYIKSYDAWVAAGCPTPTPSPSPVTTAKGAPTAAPASGTTGTAPSGGASQAATPAPTSAAGGQGGTAPAGGSGEPSGEPSGSPPAA